MLVATSSPDLEGAAIEFVWIIRQASNGEWIAPELDELKIPRQDDEEARLAYSHLHHARIGHHTTQLLEREIAVISNTDSISPVNSSASASLESLNFSITYLNSRQPSLNEIMKGFMRAERRPRSGRGLLLVGLRV